MTNYNFSPGPAVLPKEVLEEAASEMLDWHNSGMSVMEMSHRGPEFMSILNNAENDLCELLSIPPHYKVLFMQGGAIAENAIIPMNLVGRTKEPFIADYMDAGIWSKKSIQEARKYAHVNIVAQIQNKTPVTIPHYDTWKLSSDAAYLHICTNETIEGIEFHNITEIAQHAAPVPIVADMSSHILSRPINISDYGVIYAGAQKNIGSAGVTIVIVREDLLGHALPFCPNAFNWDLVAQNQSMYNTPPTYAIYIAGLVFQWLKRQGGVNAIEQHNIKKANLLYECIDQSNLYYNHVDPSCRSRMNVPFFLHDESLNESFLKGAKTQGLLQLKGHKSVGGMRASIYNAMPLEGVLCLIEYMKHFEQHHA